MGQLRQVLNSIQTQLGRLNASQKLLIGSLVVIVLMTLFVVTQYAGGPQMVPLLRGQSPEAQERAIEFLTVHNIEHRIVEGEPQVPAHKLYSTLAQMGEGQALPDDTRLLFNSLHESISWTMTSGQVEQIGNIALQNELSRVLSHFKGVRSASVFIDAPDKPGIGRASRRPTATVSLLTAGAGGLARSTVDAVANLVAGSTAGLDVKDVSVVDATAGRQYKAQTEDELASSKYLEQQQTIERTTERKLNDMLRYISGVLVTVSAQVDVRRMEIERTEVLPNGGGTVTAPTRENTTEIQSQGAVASGEAGVRSNTGMQIDRGGARGESSSETVTDSEFETEFGRRHVREIDPRGYATRINVTVNVPRSYFADLWRQDAGDDATGREPSAEEIDEVVQLEKERLKSDVSNMIVTKDDEGNQTQGDVIVSMIPDIQPMTAGLSAGGGAFAFLGGGGASGEATIPSLVKTGVLGTLALGALGIMALSLRKAAKPVDLPTPEEIVGVPPSLGDDADMVGEADEAEAALTGVEMSDDDLERRKMIEQVSHMVEERPSEAAQLLTRWIQTD